MPTVTLHPPTAPPSTPENPLPPLLHTPSGLALLEVQGTIHFPPPAPSATSTRVGKLVFPTYNPDIHGADDTKWMKRVYLYVGDNQRMVGECKKLGKPFAVVRRRGGDEDAEGDVEMQGEAGEEELQIVEVVRHKIVFSGRPEPVGGGTEET
ncbi:chromosome transmission fidelity protein 8 [Boeremia exigua]|uniref:chromosome transmission fidelity protein 8 n=1 Tax=Boeremia exigua TaxID=749465 RepID=UPI001E8DFB53|nr:chromosome transmission fidelity protein 8 [Boeremia exigua]KAH6618624.1 chromosome transmission fidelity protein 8 [Boeremia exigua]